MNESLAERPPLSWPTILFIVGTTLGALAWPVYAYVFGVTGGEIALALAYFLGCGFSITVGYHRLIAHRAYSCQPWLKAVFLIVGSAAWQGSALEWAADHIRHHSYTDTHKDPYNIRQGVWHAHVGWLFRKQSAVSVPPFLREDRLVVWQDRFYIALAITTSFVVPFLIAGVGGLLLAGIVRVVIGHHITWLVNSWAHVGTERPFNPNVSAADNWVLAFLTFGEGWHNYHHAFPTDYRNGIGKLAWDPSKWLIWALSLAGVTWDLKRVRASQQWKIRVKAAIEHATAESDGFQRLRRTRSALEKQIERKRQQLAKIAARAGLADHLTLQSSYEELYERVSQAMRDAREAVGEASRRHIERLREIVESLAVYQALLEQLAQYEAELAPARA